MEVELTEKELNHTHRIGNSKSGTKRPIPIIFKFERYSIRREAFVNKKRLDNTGISITKSLAKRRMELFKKAKSKFGFNNVLTVDGRICCYDEIAKKVKVCFD